MFNGKVIKILLVSCCLIIFLAGFGFSQKPPQKKNDRNAETPAQKRNSTKKNSRPTDNGKSEAPNFTAQTPVYFYEFSHPEFQNSTVTIEHDEDGRGTISFLKRGIEEAITDPIEFSNATLEKIKMHWQALNFLDSEENYQFEKDYSHLGNVKIKMKKKGRERTAEFNWTTNKEARALMDEYRKISNQYIWMFDINVSRENQPLETPRMMDNLDKLIRRNEISDAPQMIPFLKELSDDERIPLISRNHATRLVTRIEKELEKSRDKSQSN